MSTDPDARKMISPPLRSENVGGLIKWAQAPITRPQAAHLATYGALSFLSARDRIVRRWTNSEQRRWFEAPILTGQFCLFYEQETPRAMVTWAHLSDDAHETFLTTNEPPKLEEWFKGENVWITGFLSPFKGPAPQVAKWITENVSADVFTALRFNTNGVSAVCHYKRTDSGFAKTRVSVAPRNEASQ